MNNRLSKLLEELTPEEQSLVETFAEFVVSRRKSSVSDLLADFSATKNLAELSATLEGGNASSQGRAAYLKQHSILELKGLGKEIWQDIDVDEYLNRERSSWHG